MSRTVNSKTSRAKTLKALAFAFLVVFALQGKDVDAPSGHTNDRRRQAAVAR